MTFNFRFWGLLGVLWAGLCQVAFGGSLSINPIRIDLTESSPTAALTLENNGSAPMVVQLRLVRWTATGDEDIYDPSDDIVATPPIMTIRPGQPQIVRVGLSRSPEPAKELTYRLFFEEVPPPPKPGYQGIQVALRVAVPIFVPAVEPSAPTLRWRVVREKPNIVSIVAANSGTSHVKLSRITVHDLRSNRDVLQQPVVGYLLPGQTRKWTFSIKEAWSGGRVRLSAESDPDVTDVELDVETP